MAQNHSLAKVVIEHKKLINGFEYIEIKNTSATAKIALQGAHIFEYKRHYGNPVLWLSESSDFEHMKSIRGGIPVCWPWFGTPRALPSGRMPKDESLPQHGFARTAMWKLKNTNETDANSTEVTFSLSHTPESLKLWPHRFELELHVIVSDTLTVELKTTNLDDKAFLITQALHTYFDISHISHVRVKGLDKKPYLDALSMKEKIQDGDIIFNREIDRVYQDVYGKILLIDKNRTIKIQNEGSSSVVVWNPWVDKCKRMSAMKPSSYEGMVCIESANAFDDARIIKPNESHTLKAMIN
ncbi:MAG: D-hexose-6-phosphate mutarotase [Sulfurimonas sp.]|nr:D-hexose-6-phosphate mutarotase [Sulfurimonas sp.]